MNETNFRGVDLNLIVVFATVFRERSTTRAAACLLLSQPAISHALRRLRGLFGDSLFVRGRDGLVPTPRAEGLLRDLLPCLDRIEAALVERDGFDPSTATRTFRVGLPSAIDVCVTPGLLRAMQRQAPKATLVVRTTDLHVGPGQLDTGEIELGVSVFPEIASWHQSLSLGPRRYACLFDPKRLAVDAPLTRDAYLAADHILTSFDGRPTGVVDEALAAQGLRRRVLAATADFSSLPFYLLEARAVATLPAYAARAYAERFGLAVSPCPVDLPDFELSMIWHARNERDAGLAWLRTLLRELMSATV